MKVFVVFWTGAFEEWRLVDVFSTKEKVDEFLKDKSDSYWYVEEEVK